MARKSNVTSLRRGADPPATLAEPGRALWSKIMAEYVIDDTPRKALLEQICATTDRLAEIAARLKLDGLMVETKAGLRPHALIRHEQACRHYVSRGLRQLGLTDAPVRSGPG